MMWQKLERHLVMRKVVALSKPVLISSMNSTFLPPTITSPEQVVIAVMIYHSIGLLQQQAAATDKTSLASLRVTEDITDSK